MNPLKEARIRKRLSQKEIAEKIGSCQSYVALVESGRYFPKATYLAKLMDIYGRHPVMKYLDNLRK